MRLVISIEDKFVKKYGTIIIGPQVRPDMFDHSQKLPLTLMTPGFELDEKNMVEGTRWMHLQTFDGGIPKEEEQVLGMPDTKAGPKGGKS